MFGAAAFAVVPLAGAQATGANGFVVHPYVFADFPNSGFNTSGTFPNITFNDPHVDASGQGTGSGSFANRHIWNTSNNGGSTDYGTNSVSDFFNFSFDINLTASGGSRKEAGVFIHTGDGLDSQFIITSNFGAPGGDGGGAGEVAAFGGAFPFYRFSGTGGIAPAYTQGSTVHMGVTYFQDLTDVGHTYHLIYTYDGFNSPSMRLGNNYDVGGLPTGTTLGAYLQIPKNGTDPSVTNGATAVWTNVSVRAPVPEPATLAALGMGCLILFRRRRR